MRDLFPDEAAAALREGVEALFAHAREADGEDRTAYAVSLPGRRVYVTFVNGVVKPEGQTPARPTSRLEAVRQTISAVAEIWPDHAERVCVWRLAPVYEGTDRDWSLRTRLTAIPIAEAGHYAR